MNSIWLFEFTYYTYCQGSRDRGHGMRLIKFTLPCYEWEARNHLIEALEGEVEFNEESIRSLTINITNS